MNDREKLIELIGEATHYLLRTAQISAMADYFIANGVVIQKQGEWEDDDCLWECNQCHAWFLADYGDANMNYCPNCGAKMK